MGCVVWTFHPFAAYFTQAGGSQWRHNLTVSTVLTIRSSGTPLLAIFKQASGEGVRLTQALGAIISLRFGSFTKYRDLI
jgi:hypothetical protein